MLYGVQVPRETTPRSVRGSALQALECESTDPNAPEYACIKELLDVVDSYIPELPRGRSRQTLHDGSGRCVLDQRPWHRCDRANPSWEGPRWRPGGDHRTKLTIGCTGVEMFHKLLDDGQAEERLSAAARHQPGRC